MKLDLLNEELDTVETVESMECQQTEKMSTVEDKAYEAQKPAYADAIRQMAKTNKVRREKIDADMESAKSKNEATDNAGIEVKGTAEMKKMHLSEGLFEDVDNNTNLYDEYIVVYGTEGEEYTETFNDEQEALNFAHNIENGYDFAEVQAWSYSGLAGDAGYDEDYDIIYVYEKDELLEYTELTGNEEPLDSAVLVGFECTNCEREFTVKYEKGYFESQEDLDNVTENSDLDCPYCGAYARANSTELVSDDIEGDFTSTSVLDGAEDFDSEYAENLSAQIDEAETEDDLYDVENWIESALDTSYIDIETYDALMAKVEEARSRFED